MVACIISDELIPRTDLGAALFLHSYWRLTTVDHGFNAAPVLLIDTGSWGGDFGVSGELPPRSAWRNIELTRSTCDA